MSLYHDNILQSDIYPQDMSAGKLEISYRMGRVNNCILGHLAWTSSVLVEKRCTKSPLERLKKPRISFPSVATGEVINQPPIHPIRDSKLKPIRLSRSSATMDVTITPGCLVPVYRSKPSMSRRDRGPTTSSSHTQRSNSTHIACTHCRQYGHSANDCPSQGFHSSWAQPQRMGQQNGESSIPCQTCGTPCILRTANTANNRGRKFYSCQSQGCNFFVWEDSLGNSNGRRSAPRGNNSSSVSNTRSRGGHGRGNGSGRGGRSGHNADMTFVSATGDPISSRRCWVCGDPLHFANVCPNRATGDLVSSRRCYVSGDPFHFANVCPNCDM
ncbi:DNA topoisomerase 3-alpha [Sarracenia purpurea var. burkii]